MKSPNRNKPRRVIATGIWQDEDGHIHWSVQDLLKMVDLEDTAENRKIVMAMLRNVISTNHPNTEIIERQTPND